VADIPLAEIGSLFENLPIFPARTNTEFVEVGLQIN
jgi:diaminopimelate epimerase